MSNHTVTSTIVGAGTGSTYYLVTCTCGWRYEDYSAMNAYDRAVLHQSKAADR